MKFASVLVDGIARYGVIEDEGFIDLTSTQGWADLSDVADADGYHALALAARGRTPVETEITYLPPLPRPGKIICVGVNFPDRNAEYKDGKDAPPNPSLFIRFPESFTGHDRPLIRPPESPQLDYEGEIAIVIGKAGRRIAEEDALDHVSAATVCNEGTIRDWVRHAKFNVTQGKNWFQSAAMGPWLVPVTAPAQLRDVGIETRVNGEVRQQDRTGRMIFPIPFLIRYISTFTPLAPGDVIVTGTPTGAGARFDPPRFLAPGDVVEVEVEGLGTLLNTVADEDQGA